MDKQIEKLASTYLSAQKALVRQLNNVDITDFQRARSMALLAQVNAQIADLDKYSRSWAVESIPMAYEHGLGISENRLKALKITKRVNFDSQIHKGAVSILVDDVTMDLLTSNQTIKQSVARFIRQSQQQVIEDKAISQRIAEGMIQGDTRRQISGKILSDFRKQLGEEKFIAINGRNYQPEAYSRLLARARFTEAANQANVNAALQYGLDLVQVSVSSGGCDLCDEYQGKIFSISGNDPDYPLLEERPPYHPNCRHQLLPITRESLEDRGLLEGTIKFSNQSGGVSSFSEFEEKVNV